MPSTIQDIADRLHISKTTVHRALTNTGRISEKTKAKILEIAQEIDYRPNDIARSLRSKRSQTIGLILRDITVGHYYSEILSGIEEIARDVNYSINIGCSGGDVTKEKRLIYNFYSRQVDGIIIAPVSSSASENYEFLKKEKLPFIFMDKYIPEIETDVVTSDSRGGIAQAINHLVRLGHQKIAFLSGLEYPSITILHRIDSYKTMLAQNNLSFQQIIFSDTYGTDDRQCGYYAMRDYLMNQSDRATAVVCVNDSLAIGTMKAVKEAGLSIPRDMAIVGNNNDKITEYLDPQLTTISQPKVEMGRRAMMLLLKRIEHYSERDYAFNEFPTTLVVRGST